MRDTSYVLVFFFFFGGGLFLLGGGAVTFVQKPKRNVIARLEFELTYSGVTVLAH